MTSHNGAMSPHAAGVAVVNSTTSPTTKSTGTKVMYSSPPPRSIESSTELPPVSSVSSQGCKVRPKFRRGKSSISNAILFEHTAAHRLVEYFVIVSCERRRSAPTRYPSSLNSDDLSGSDQKQQQQKRPHSSSAKFQIESNKYSRQVDDEECTYNPTITARYPLKDYDDNPLNQMISQFCFPTSDIVTPSTTYELPRVHYFVLTTGRGRKVYGTCLTVMEEVVEHEHDCSSTAANDNDTAVPFDEESEDGSFHSSSIVASPTPDEDHESAGFELTVGSNRQKKLPMYLPRVLCLLSTWPYLTAFREYLSQLYRLMTSTNVMTVPLERYVCNICEEIPAPPPGAYEIQIDILDSTIRLWAPPAKLPIAYVALPYHILFECLEVDNILFLWRALLVERKIILLSSQHSTLTVCAEILCSLIFPLRWSHLYVPLLPRMLCPILDAPVPFLCGIVRENWLHAQQYMPADCVIVDLDSNRVQVGNIVPLPTAPVRKFTKLRNAVNETVGHVFWEARGVERQYKEIITAKVVSKRSLAPLRLSVTDARCWKERMTGQDHAFKLAYSPDSPNLKANGEDWTEPNQWDRLQESFLRFFVATFKTYRKHLFIPTPSVELSSSSNYGSSSCTSTPSSVSTVARFDADGFISKAKVESVPFLKEVCMTQQFDDFITRKILSPGEPDLHFFDQSIDAKLNRSKLKIKKVDTPLLNSAKVHKDLKKLKSLPPNQKDIPDGFNIEVNGYRGPYVYKRLPASFDESLFIEPRPIPTMISAEFDRQAILVAKLRSEVLVDTDDVSDGAHTNDAFVDFCSSDFDPSPEVGSFTTFLFVYCSFVGTEWQKYLNKSREQPNVYVPKGSRVDSSREVKYESNQKALFVDTSDTIINSTASTDSRLRDCVLEDLSFGLVEACPEPDAFGLGSALLSFGTEVEGAYHLLCPKASVPLVIDPISESTVLPTRARSPIELSESNAETEEREEAREVASAQLDLSFETLSTMALRGLPTDADAYLSVMNACARCGNTKNSVYLMEMMREDGICADAKILACFMDSFVQHDIIEHRNSLQIRSDEFWRRSLPEVFNSFDSDDGSQVSVSTQGDTSIRSSKTTATAGTNGSSNMKCFFPTSLCSIKSFRRRRKNKSVISDLNATPIFSRQLELSETLFDIVYPDLVMDTQSDSCPHCSYNLSEDDIVTGWIPCSFQNYTTQCPKCGHRFVPRFVVTCSSPDFQGSQGYQTPLFCEYLSPWILRRELDDIIKFGDGIEALLDPEWRSGTDIRATIFWNFVVLCRRYKLPCIFLLQGNFQNRLILPRSPDAM